MRQPFLSGVSRAVCGKIMVSVFHGGLREAFGRAGWAERGKRKNSGAQREMRMRKLTEDERFMKAAMAQARKAAALDEVPIGCVIVREGKIIARGYNRRNTDKNTLSHAELNAIRKASKKLGDWRLEGCTIYVTLEPCQMCAGAIVQARITRAVMGSMNAKAGCAGSVLNILQMESFNHQVEVTKGVLKEECSRMLSDFFKGLRQRKKAEKKEVEAEETENLEKTLLK